MKNYIYKFRFFSGFYSQYFYQQINALDEKEALIDIVSFFNEQDSDDTLKLLNKELGKKWTVEKFWDEMELKFSPNDDYVAYNLINIREVNFNLDSL